MGTTCYADSTYFKPDVIEPIGASARQELSIFIMRGIHLGYYTWPHRLLPRPLPCELRLQPKFVTCEVIQESPRGGTSDRSDFGRCWGQYEVLKACFMIQSVLCNQLVWRVSFVKDEADVLANKQQHHCMSILRHFFLAIIKKIVFQIIKRRRIWSSV